MVAKPPETGVLLQVGHVERFNRAVRAAAAYLDEPRFFQTERLAPFQPRGTDGAGSPAPLIPQPELVPGVGRSRPAQARATGGPPPAPHPGTRHPPPALATRPG